jgi:hypothetical protein
VWHTIPGPQFASAVQALGWHDLMTIGVDGGGATFGHADPGGQSGAIVPEVVVTPESTQVKLCGQSLSVVQVWAAALPPRPMTRAEAMVVIPRRNFVDGIVLGLSWAVACRKRPVFRADQSRSCASNAAALCPAADRKIAVPLVDSRAPAISFLMLLGEVRRARAVDPLRRAHGVRC